MEPSDSPLYCVRNGERRRIDLGGQIRTAEREVAHRVRKAISFYDMGTGDQLPSENEMSRAFDISRDPVRRGLNVLKAEKVVEARKGSGWFVL